MHGFLAGVAALIRRVGLGRGVGIAIALAFLVFVLIHESRRPGLSLAEIRASGELLILTRNAAGVYFVDRDDEPAGLEYELTAGFARELGVQPHFVTPDSFAELLSGLEAGGAHMAAAGLTDTERRGSRLVHSQPYETVNEQVVCRRGAKLPRTMADLAKVELVVKHASSFDEHLAELKLRNPELSWQVRDETVENLLEEVSDGDIGCTVADTPVVNLNRRYYPELEVAMNLGGEHHLVWYFPPGADELKTAADRWLDKLRDSGELVQLIDKYFGFAGNFDYVDTRVFARSVATVLPQYRGLMEDAAEEAGLPWTLLAAIAYQESQWQNNARSPTGVRGLMMLTQSTAKSMGVGSRLDPAQNLHAGAMYLAALKQRLPAEMQEPDRTWIALAAYNIGYGHVTDAQRLARERGLDPNTWLGVKQTLPMLTNPAIFRRLDHGYARGRAPVHYVARVRHFEDLLGFHLSRG